MSFFFFLVIEHNHPYTHRYHCYGATTAFKDGGESCTNKSSICQCSSSIGAVCVPEKPFDGGGEAWEEANWERLCVRCGESGVRNG